MIVVRLVRAAVEGTVVVRLCKAIITTPVESRTLYAIHQATKKSTLTGKALVSGRTSPFEVRSRGAELMERCPSWLGPG